MLSKTTADLPSTQSMLNTQFLPHSALWSKHCGIVSLNPSIFVTPYFITIDQRVIACHISHVNHLFPPTIVLVIYAPAQRVQREPFFESLLQLPLIQQYSPSSDDILSFNPDPALPPILILGNFNFQISNYQGKSYSDQPITLLPTYRLGNRKFTIDYIFASPALFNHLHSATVDFINSAWTDHAFLGCTFTFASQDQEPGLWRAHTNLAQNKYFKDTLITKLDQFHSLIQATSESATPQEQWDTVKDITKTLARQVGRRKAAAHLRLLSHLQRKRNKLLWDYKLTSILPLKLETTENQIGAMQQDRVDTLALRAGRHWRENGETSAGYLKSSITSRSIKHNISILNHPHTHQLCTSSRDMQSAATAF
ncbi:hypothetical protein A0J61_11117 [Choanephora cucurbitarum]|uniref:Endonuclease/exonuclease/phosphatase domain-containing protein n=1 Tax=Choanephora cucurbitarum TaxID=101091 RepID=A0A1C7N0F6_9FUNG|nr:hypothetical protein A0J61_11117 [Choanephora cucurbitarum]